MNRRSFFYNICLYLFILLNFRYFYLFFFPWRLFFCLLNKTVLPVWIAWFLGFWIGLFFSNCLNNFHTFNKCNTLWLTSFSNISCLGIWFINWFWRWLILNKNSKFLIIWAIRRIKTLWRLWKFMGIVIDIDTSNFARGTVKTLNFTSLIANLWF